MPLSKNIERLSKVNTVVKTSSFSVDADQNYYLCDLTGTTFSATIPAASSEDGRVLTFKKTDSTFNALQSSGSVFTLTTEGETIRIVSDGTNWLILDRYIPNKETQYTVAITSTGTNPTKASTTDVDSATWSRIGRYMKLRYLYTHSNNAGAAAGTGDYKFSIPSGVNIDFTDIASNGNHTAGTFFGYSTTRQSEHGNVLLVNTDTNTVKLRGVNHAFGSALAGATITPLNDNDITFSFECLVPIAGWES